MIFSTLISADFQHVSVLNSGTSSVQGKFFLLYMIECINGMVEFLFTNTDFVLNCEEIHQTGGFNRIISDITYVQ